MTSTAEIILSLLNIAVNVYFIYRLLKMGQNLKTIAAQIEAPKASLADVIQNVEPTETPFTGTFTPTDTKVGN